MASYISSYFGGGSGAGAANPSTPQYQPQYQQQPTQPTSTWGNTFSNRIGALRKALTKGSEEDDPDNEDCSHVSNVLRAYYMEKGRPFPEWLPPDPKKPSVAPVVQQPPMGQYGSMYPGQYGNNGMPHSRGNSGGRGGISDLWDSGPGQQSAPQPQSLRAQRPPPQALRSFDSSGRQSSSDSHTSQARPLPSQRARSNQNIQATSTPPPSGNARDRLRARLQGGGNSARSSSPASGSQGSYDRPGSGSGVPSMSATQPWANDGNQYGLSAGYDTAAGSGYGNMSYQQRSGNYR